MPEDTNTPVVEPLDVAAANQAVIDAQKAQDINGQRTGGFNFDTNSALDDLRDKTIKEKTEELDQNDPEKKAAAEKLAAEEAAKVKAEADAKALQDKAAAGDPDAATRVEEARKKAEADAAAADAVKKRTDEIFKDSPALPPNASPKSNESFAAIKARAATEIMAAEKKAEELQKRVAELEAKANQPVPDEIKNELQSLREFRAKLDIESDPKFKTFDAEISKTHEFIYAQLKKSPAITDKVIADIKALGGPENVNMEPIIEAIKDPVSRRLVEAKLADIEMTQFNKKSAIEAAKANIQKYHEEREKEFSAIGNSHNDATKAKIVELSGKIPWLNHITPDPKATDKAAAEEAAKHHNAYADKINSEIQMALQDDSPEMRATLTIGMAQLFRLQDAQAVLNKDRDRLKTENEDLKKQIEKLKSPGAARLRQSGAPAGGSIIPAPPKLDPNEKAGDAIDRLREAKRKEQAAAA